MKKQYKYLARFIGTLIRIAILWLTYDYCLADLFHLPMISYWQLLCLMIWIQGIGVQLGAGIWLSKETSEDLTTQ